ncbi:hypothetical protein A1O7_02850 [Cladophialophora yegresii CBS 114405]|uniref:Transcription factor domain-containing protein n=1 Tax=Cladophialophora yegresii CBS 114405 TaxID=1182544 RepID=W9WBQ8_9EURO|nr:uncharacterized protein A1O7_02850 [Cladophialophora yegresii CBS 114405]EXJ62415.1 hypothetical protein A1O7_02850 [Cladophialophora yegresii CBS 114405]
MSQQIHFVETQPGTALDSGQVRALRSHVRKVNLERSNRKSTQQLENFRSLTITDFSGSGKAKGAKRKQSFHSNVAHLETVIQEFPWGDDPPQGYPLAPDSPGIPTRAFRCLPNQLPPKRCSCHRPSPQGQQSPSSSEHSTPSDSPHSEETHPQAAWIVDATDVDEDQINQLLRSCAFQIEAESLLSFGLANCDLWALPLFPDCLYKSAFLYAFLYSILHIHNSYIGTNESLALKTKAIECLREDLRKDDPNIRALTIGTVLLLSCVAYHCGDLAESTAHSEGLYKLLEHYHADGVRLRTEVLRAIFW